MDQLIFFIMNFKMISLIIFNADLKLVHQSLLALINSNISIITYSFYNLLELKLKNCVELILNNFKLLYYRF